MLNQVSDISGVIFDLDGTLVDSLSATFDGFNHGIVSQGGKALTPKEIMKYFGPGEGEIFAQIVGRDKAKAAYAEALQYLDRNLGRVPLHQGVPELLDQLAQSNIPVSIVTGRSWNTTEMILQHHGLLDRFVTVIANDHVGSPKPSPEGIQLALQRMKLVPERAIYVGDTWVDIRAAHSAGVGAVAALWDLMADRSLMEAHTPHHWAENPEHVWALVSEE